MALFGLGKKQEGAAAPECCCGGGGDCAPEAAEAAKTAEAAGECCGGAAKGVCCVKVLGAGCKSCHELYENAQAAVRSMGLGVEVEYITDMEKVMTYGVMSMPAIVVNEKVVSMGKVLKAAEVEKLLKELAG